MIFIAVHSSTDLLTVFVNNGEYCVAIVLSFDAFWKAEG